MTANPSEPGPQPPKIDTRVPHSARIWNYWLGGKDNYEVDRRAGDQYAEAFPQIIHIARSERAFLGRVVRHLVGQAGIRQILDIGAGLPAVDNTHEIAQREAPECHVVYVDNDPLVLAHARALLTSMPEGRTDYIDADMRQPDTIVQAASLLFDPTRPVALTFMGVLGHIGNHDQARSIVHRILDALPTGSYLAINDGTNTSPQLNTAQQLYNDSGAIPYHLRSPAQIAGFFDGLDLIEPGVVPVPLWHPDAPTQPATPIPQFGGVGRKRSAIPD